MLMQADRSLLVVVDLQEKILPVMANHSAILQRSALLMKIASTLKVPVVVTEQYPRGLGPTVPAIAEHLSELPIEKMEFGAAANAVFQARLEADAIRDQVVICGIEAHVCVLQTALGLAGMGRPVFVVEDAVSSRHDSDREAALRRMRHAGVQVVTTEMVLFEWLHQAGTPEFKTLAPLIR